MSLAPAVIALEMTYISIKSYMVFSTLPRMFRLMLTDQNPSSQRGCTPPPHGAASKPAATHFCRLHAFKVHIFTLHAIIR